MRSSSALKHDLPIRQTDGRQEQPQKRVKLKPQKSTNVAVKFGIGTLDQTIYLIVCILVLFGLMMVFSASYVDTARSTFHNYNPFFYLQRHAIMATLGFFGMNVMANFNYRYLKRFAMVFYLVALGLMVAVVIWGVARGGASRWIMLPIINIQFQPSEIAKVAVILILARILSANKRVLENWGGFFFCMVLVGALTILVAYGDLSSAIIVAIIGGGMIFMASPHIKRFLAMVAAAVAGMFGYLYYLANHAGVDATGQWRGQRFLAWQNPFDDPLGYGFQVIQSLFAIASGGWFGLGIGQSRQKFMLPEAHNDVIFAIIIEELGVIGAGIILILFVVLIWRGLHISQTATDSFGSLIAFGIILMIGSQLIINLAVVTNSIPNTGITMPFISYGGTSLVVIMGCIGILLNISRHSKL
ncbi:MAG: putative lipid II flippase FtsW [Defluviitaleaceae bacterium]|nr:putative lipid II flippase FtsW [Defluviitaleaceae bacterium]